MTDLNLDSTAEPVQAPSDPVVEGPQDIDPATWLQASSELITGYVDVKGGRLKVAALTEAESETIRKLSESIDPNNVKGPRKLNVKKLRQATVAFSINKAYGYTPADPRYIAPDRLNPALAGEITMIMKRITEIGGFVDEDQGNNLDALFQTV